MGDGTGCGRFRKWLDDCADPAAATPELEDLTRHAQACPACAASLEDLARARGLLDGVRLPGASQERLLGRVMHRVASASASASGSGAAEPVPDVREVSAGLSLPRPEPAGPVTSGGPGFSAWFRVAMPALAFGVILLALAWSGVVGRRSPGLPEPGPEARQELAIAGRGDIQRGKETLPLPADGSRFSLQASDVVILRGGPVTIHLPGPGERSVRLSGNGRFVADPLVMSLHQPFRGRLDLRLKGQRFSVQLPTAVLAIRGTLLDITLAEGFAEVRVVEGVIDWQAVSGPGHGSLQAGEGRRWGTPPPGFVTPASGAGLNPSLPVPGPSASSDDHPTGLSTTDPGGLR
ncbi:MAG: hypothetical protein GX442_03830 [Candidatus Riflebacteria bacterium]|nr:hypothetical protein [Candidatus Riflebacteria bacterium]